MATKKPAAKTSTNSTSPAKPKAKPNPGDTTFGIDTRQNVAQVAPDVAAQSTAQQGQAALADAARIDTSQQGQFRDRQSGFADDLLAQARGQGPSIAGLQLQAGLDSNIQAQLALSRSGANGLNPAIAQHQALMGIGQAQQQTALQAAMARVKEQQDAQQRYADLINQSRGQDIGLATNQAQLIQAANLQNAQNLTNTSNNNAQLGTQTANINAQLASAANTVNTQTALQRATTAAEAQEKLRQAAIAKAASDYAAKLGYKGHIAGIQSSDYQFNQNQLNQIGQYGVNNVNNNAQANAQNVAGNSGQDVKTYGAAASGAASGASSVASSLGSGASSGAGAGGASGASGAAAAA